MFPLHPLFLGFLVALGIGLLIGIDRERKKGEGPARHAAGLRTFTLAALLGAVAIVTGGELLLAAVALGVVAFAGLSYWRARDSDPGLTTETALVLVTLLGGLAIREPAFAAALGVVVAVLLAARSALHRFVLSGLTDQEVRSLLVFAAATLVVLPLLPDHAIGPYGALNLHTIWIVVILVMAVSALGYIAVRLLGARYGLPLTGVAAGFISSIATIGSMGARARKDPQLLLPAVAGAVLSSIATTVQLAILIAATSLETLKVFYLPLVFSGAAALLYGGVFTLWALRHTAEDHEPPGSAFSVAHSAHLRRDPRGRPAGRRGGAGLVRRGRRPGGGGQRRFRRHALGRRLRGRAGQGTAHRRAAVRRPDPGRDHDEYHQQDDLRRERRRAGFRPLCHPGPSAARCRRLGWRVRRRSDPILRSAARIP